ncbi:hypothetical protein D1007_40344 [Hordeum vulgare]|nr:hypothetical protein D1007_40344 [Hordeum vulgare]
MRGFTLDDDDEGTNGANTRWKDRGGNDEEDEGDWCRFEYEFLPDLGYTCDIIGHGGKDCVTKLKKEENPQFGNWLRANMGQRRGNADEGLWRIGGRGGGSSRSYGYNRSGGRSGSGSDSLSWRKDGSRATERGEGKTKGGEEVTSPSKTIGGQARGGVPKKLELGAMGNLVVVRGGGGGEGGAGSEVVGEDKVSLGQTHSMEMDPYIKGKLVQIGELSANLGAMASPNSPKDKFFVNVINPYLAEVKRHPQTLWLEDGVLHKEDLKGPVKEGSTKARMEEVEQEVFKYKLMIERGVEANFDIIAELKKQHEEEMKEVRSSISAHETKILETEESCVEGGPLPWKLFAKDYLRNKNKDEE